jgi:glyceraldehyde-3-phosphate dehydrogenase/erythrose-4-phosphate dehydrogenase
MLNERAAKVVCWYDNECRYSCRMVDLVTCMAGR